MVREAELRETEDGVVPAGDGWFVLNARDARWDYTDALGSYCSFEGEARFPQLGININVLAPGQPMSMYHAENTQEDFLVVAGTCVLVIEGRERTLTQWDFVHCPPWTEHVFVGAGEGLCVIVAVGARPTEGVRYPAAPLAQKHGAAALADTTVPREAYARFAPPEPGPYRDGLLPELGR